MSPETLGWPVFLAVGYLTLVGVLYAFLAVYVSLTWVVWRIEQWNIYRRNTDRLRANIDRRRQQQQRSIRVQDRNRYFLG